MTIPTTPDLRTMLEQADLPTVGTWEVEYDDYYKKWIPGFEIKGSLLECLDCGVDAGTNNQADARLIASAPELAQRVIDQDAELQRLREGIEALITDCMTVALDHAKRLKYDNGVYDDTANRLRALLGDQS